MKKTKPNKEVLLQFIYDNGIEEACSWWNINRNDIDKILNPKLSDAPKIRSYGKKDIQLDDKVSSVITKNYESLLLKYVKDKSTLSMCQTSEDVFHNTLLKIMEELSVMNEEQILEYIDYRFKMINYQTKQDQKELYKHQINLENANNC